MRTIPEKESLTIEFKSDRSGYSDADLVDEIVGMANTQGGDLYLGVEDDGEITGVGKKRQDPVGAMALIANKTIPSVSVRAEIIAKPMFVGLARWAAPLGGWVWKLSGGRKPVSAVQSAWK